MSMAEPTRGPMYEALLKCVAVITALDESSKMPLAVEAVADAKAALSRGEDVTTKEDLLGALESVLRAGGGHGHWDPEMTGGANCPLCQRWREVAGPARELLRRARGEEALR